jgi:hypothetical protein
MRTVAPESGGVLSRRRYLRKQTMTISRAVVVAALRERGQHDRADFVARELPDRIDPSRHRGLLAMLNLDVAELAGSDNA